jgi:hypothetical protein
MSFDAKWLLKSVTPDANTIQMPTLQVHVWAVYASDGVTNGAAETI